MPQTKRAAQRKRRSKVVLALGAAGLSLSLGGSASAAIGGVNPDTVSQQGMLYEEEIADVSLATFHVFDKERAGIHKGRTQRLAMGVGGCGCAGCGCACGSVCILTTHRWCLATRSIRRRLGRSARRTNIDLTARASHNDLQLLFTKTQLDDLQSAQSFGTVKAYGRSKLCNILFTRELARRLRGTGMTPNCLHRAYPSRAHGNCDRRSNCGHDRVCGSIQVGGSSSGEKCCGDSEGRCRHGQHSARMRQQNGAR